MSVLDESRRHVGGDGEMAQRIRAFDWSMTELGPIERWPQSLVSVMQVVLASPVPMVVLWGADGYMLYNDAYAVFAGGRHPYLLGCPVEQGWPEVAAFNRRVLETCLAGGTLTYRDKELVLLRDGKPEDVWMDLYYSPVAGDDDVPAGVIAVVVETTERVLTEQSRQRAEVALRLANERLQLALNTGAVLGTWVWDVGSGTVSGDERFTRTFGDVSQRKVRGIGDLLSIQQVDPDDVAQVQAQMLASLRAQTPFRAEYRITRANGEFLWVQSSGQWELDAHGGPHRLPGVLIDIHERKVAEAALVQLTATLEQRVKDAVSARAAVEAQLRQAQKMEALGSLTGGVAHDFNNVLQVINGNLQMLSAELANHPVAQRRIATAAEAVRRGARLASHLLAFARRQPLSPSVVCPRQLLEGMDEMIHRSLGETVNIDTIVPDDLWNVLVDRNQLENALLNLAINARDAMRGEGRLTIAARNVMLDGKPDNGHGGGGDTEVRPGEYVCFSVSDTGVGMSAEVLEHAFEPFYTTKPEGHGTGLGLSMVFGFVKQSGGHMEIDSVVGRGTTVELFFPRSLETPCTDSPATLGGVPRGNETVLIVEDDADVRLTAVDMIAQLGYQVLTASTGDEAKAILLGDARIDLLFTDVVMPGDVKSPELARLAAQRVPSVPVVFTSGYTRDEIFHHGRLDPGVTLLAKPYRRDELAHKLRSALEGQSGGRAMPLQSALSSCNDESPSPSIPPAESVSPSPLPSLVAAQSAAPGPCDEEGQLPCHVLLVEDDAPSREAMRDLIEVMGLRCCAAGSAEEALKRAAAQRYDVLLSDLTLPGMAGDQLALALRRTQPHVHVFLMSGYGQCADVDPLLDDVPVLQKPLDALALGRRLAACRKSA
ncbi:hybrid sensor histidine kinase/response regulator [Mycetohabitans endofungorum]|uniref:hybrid sensor histidine kinase/response regulator n=1 Tax=Mycetohabitans endofungorum TaxID=417203 RepID=UPI002B060BC3|nr:response regulator [Mycetohabitans endofungorum]